jgi:glycosyltransferase involved in cell wall biosynthesis
LLDAHVFLSNGGNEILMKKRNKILYLSVSIDPNSGWGTIAHDMAHESLRSSAVDFEIWIPKSESSSICSGLQAFTKPILPEWVGDFGNKFWRAWPFLNFCKENQGFDFINSLVEFPYSILANRLASRWDIPFSIMSQGTYAAMPFRNWSSRYFYTRALKNASFFTSPSEYTAETVSSRIELPRPIKVIPNPIDTRFAEADSNPEQLLNMGIRADDRFILSVGALKPRKGFDLLIGAFARIAESLPDTKLVIAGEGQLKADLNGLARQLGVSDRVIIPGRVDEDTLAALYQECTFFSLLPRVVDGQFEGFGLVFLEAGVCGKPSVAADSGGVTNAVLDGKTGILVPPDDEMSAADALARMFNESDLLERLGSNARAFALTNSWQKYVETYEGWYQASITERV